MKHTLLLPFVLASLTLTSCGFIRGVDTTTASCKIDTDCKETEMCYFKPEGTVGACMVKPIRPDSNSEVVVTSPDPIVPTENPKTPTPTSSKNTTQTNPENNTPKTSEVSTEELTKELDAFVDDITKGL